MPVYRMLVAYDGQPYHGFARQPDLPTVQGALEQALSVSLQVPVETVGAGRTDTGVHALGQVVSFRTESGIQDLARVQRSLNRMCGPTIAVLDLSAAADDFDARHSAVSRTYEYAILTREVHDPFSRHTTWHHPSPLDSEAMGEAARALVGEHDFSSFGRVEEGRSPVRRVHSLEVEQATPDLLVVRITASSFIQQMVRSVVGTLAKVGAGETPAQEMDAILHAHDRAAAGPVAPPQGLFLASVSYDQ